MAKLVEQVANANDCIEALDEIFIRSTDDSTNVSPEGSVNS